MQNTSVKQSSASVMLSHNLYPCMLRLKQQPTSEYYNSNSTVYNTSWEWGNEARLNVN